MDAVTAGTRTQISPYAVFDRGSWRALAAGSTLPLDEAGLRALASLGDRIDLDEVATVYLPLAHHLLDVSPRHHAARPRLLQFCADDVHLCLAHNGPLPRFSVFPAHTAPSFAMNCLCPPRRARSSRRSNRT